MSLRTSLVALALLAVMAPEDAEARRKRSFGGKGRSDYVANGTFGLGLELGGPTGLNGKYFLTDSTALNFGLGWNHEGYYGYRYRRRGVHLYLDHLWHPVQLTETEPFKLPFYVGVGVRVWNWDEGCRGCDYDGTVIGVRAPLGIAFDFNNIPLDIFVQLVLIADIFFDDYADRYERFGIHLEGSLGVRFWFD